MEMLVGAIEKMEPSASELVELLRLDVSRRTTDRHKAALGQFLTPLPIARQMAAMFLAEKDVVRILDPGAGAGALFTACVAELANRENPPTRIEVDAFEIDPELSTLIDGAFHACHEECRANEIEFGGRLHVEDYLEAAVDALSRGLLSQDEARQFDCAVLNPPYFKIPSGSPARRLVERLSVPTSNMYTAFVAATVQWLAPGGEIVAITPRSFCNGSYFRPFREFFVSRMSLRRLHVFESRGVAFSDDAVLQENIIFHAVKDPAPPASVEISLSEGPDDAICSHHRVPFERVVRPRDPEKFIHILPDELSEKLTESFASFTSTLADLGLTVSTGRVVDFRARDHLHAQPAPGDAPLIYPLHMSEGGVRWPQSTSKKPNAIIDSTETEELLVPHGDYVLVKRFSSKEEKRRIVAAHFDSRLFSHPRIGIENHINYVHRNGHGIEPEIARGLTAYLNSTLVDCIFRQFSGHTQVNATDLRSLRYPSSDQLRAVARQLSGPWPSQDGLDELIQRLIAEDDLTGNPEYLLTMKRIQEALDVLRSLGFPRAQLNDRSALTLLALLDLRPRTPWSKANNPLRGITPMMDFFASHYGKKYAPNSRETVRRQTVHQFLEAGLIVANPDQPDRPTNSGNNVYRIEESALTLLQAYGSRAWNKQLKAYLDARETLKERYAQEREMARIPIVVGANQSITLSPGGQNVLVKHVIEDFAPRFTPGGKLIYLGDTDSKWAHFDEVGLRELGVTIEAHGKMPDVIIHHMAKDWLVLVEAVTSHGPVDPKRHAELKRLFHAARIGLVFVTAFLDRKGLLNYLGDISWETEVWVAESPGHLIHFNGERFLGPYPTKAPLVTK